MSRVSNRLKEVTNMLHVVQKYIHPITKKGDAFFFHCPNPAHEDRHASAYTKDGWNNIICTSCGFNCKGIDFLQLVAGLSFQEACDELAEINGNPDWYDWKGEKKERKHSLSPKDLRILGLSGLPETLSKQLRTRMLLVALEEKKKRYQLLNKDTSELQEIERKISLLQ